MIAQLQNGTYIIDGSRRTTLLSGVHTGGEIGVTRYVRSRMTLVNKRLSNMIPYVNEMKDKYVDIMKAIRTILLNNDSDRVINTNVENSGHDETQVPLGVELFQSIPETKSKEYEETTENVVHRSCEKVIENPENDLEEESVCSSSMSIPSINDIALFYTRGREKSTDKSTDKSKQEDGEDGDDVEDGRKTNGQKNEMRERIIEMLPNLPEQYAKDSRWTELRDKLMKTIRDFSPYPNYTFRISRKGGRSSSYDFEFIFTNTDTSETTVRKIEFKNSNTSTIDKIPQIYQKACNTTNIFSDNVDLFPAYYYKHGLSQYCKTDNTLCEPLPTLEEYVKKCTPNKSTHPFFMEMRNRRHSFVNEKHAIVDSTITDYIQLCVDSVQLDKVSDILRQTQTDKTYLLWNYKTLEFHIDQIPNEELVITRVSETTKNTIVFQANKYKYHFLLRWKNDKGILNPAWQVSISAK
jgi:hypothetical protein